jgi:DNA polymerase-3 subunit gamma/tau
LATTDPLKLPATILSRTQHFRFKRISILNVVHHLQHILQLENITYEDAALEILARSGSGSLRDTLTLLDQAIIYSKNHVDVQTVTDMLGLVDPQSIEAIFSAIFNNDREALLAHIRELEEYEAEMVVDELIAFLKERLYAQDGRYSILLLERFFRILSDAKSLFSINADGGFVLSMIFFKMLEAMKVKEIDQMIESLEAQIGSGAPIPKHHETQPVQAAPTAEKAEPATEAPKTPEEPVMPAEKAVEPPVADDAKERALFDQLIQKIEDRSIDLGRCFKEKITFVSYRDNLLIWESCADEECKKQLKHGYSVIKQFVREIFGFETQIKAQKCSKAAPQTPPEPTPTPQPQTEAPQDVTVPQTPPQQQMQQPAPDTMQNAPQPSSMTEESEVGTGSCVAGCSESDQSTKEFDGQAILEEPMIQKATELFEATKITIQNKV